MNARREAEALAAQLAAARPLNAAAIHRVARDYARDRRDASGAEILSVAIALSAHERLGFRITAFLIVVNHKAALAAVRARDLDALAAHLDDWSDVDTLMLVSGRAWRAGQVSDAYFAKLARSSTHGFAGSRSSPLCRSTSDRMAAAAMRRGRWRCAIASSLIGTT